MTTPDPVAALGEAFASSNVEVNGTAIHCVRGGEGPPVVLIHGFPQDWSEFAPVMPRLAERFTVVAVDLRGIGGSAPAEDGHDAVTMAHDVERVVEALGLNSVTVVGHDLGGAVAYVFARRYPERTRAALILDSPIVGEEGFGELAGDPRMWHGDFHMIPDLPEALVDGRQEIYIRYFLDIGTREDTVVPEEAITRYARAYGDRARLRAAFGMYRTFGTNLAFFEAYVAPTGVSFLLAAGEGSPFAPLLPKSEAYLRGKGVAHVDCTVIPGAVHYLIEDQPEAVADLIERHASTNAHQGATHV